jgi:hypothetical protein
MNVGPGTSRVNNMFRCRDGAFVLLEAGPPGPKLLDGYFASSAAPTTQVVSC